jgi:hypothetical protein
MTFVIDQDVMTRGLKSESSVGGAAPAPYTEVQEGMTAVPTNLGLVGPRYGPGGARVAPTPLIRIPCRPSTHFSPMETRS